MAEKRPFVVLTNDDGVKSPGLHAIAAELQDIADVLIAAPNEQQSGMGRSMPVTSTGNVHEHQFVIEGKTHIAYGIEGTPAQAVQQGVLEIAGERKPDLLISGINYGDNCGNGITISGTVGAALEAAALGIPAIAISQRTPKHLHLTYSEQVDFSIGAFFAKRFALWLLENRSSVQQDIDVLKIDLPTGATRETPWRITRLSRTRVYWPVRTSEIEEGAMGYSQGDTSNAEPDSDVYAVFEDHVVSVTPLSLDMTSRTDFKQLQTSFNSIV